MKKKEIFAVRCKATSKSSNFQNSKKIQTEQKAPLFMQSPKDSDKRVT